MYVLQRCLLVMDSLKNILLRVISTFKSVLLMQRHFPKFCFENGELLNVSSIEVEKKNYQKSQKSR